MRKRLSVLLLVSLFFTAIPNYVLAQSSISDEAQAHILNELNRANIPNAAIAVIQDGEISYILKDSEHDTLFQLGSVAKSFTSFGVLLLEDMGLLSVSDPVNQHLPWFWVNYNGVPVPHEDITIYNLLQNTSGFMRVGGYTPILSREMSKDEIIALLVGDELTFYPSESYAYANENFILLGYIIEAVSGQSYDEFMTQHVLHPLGLYDTFTDLQRAYDTGRVIGGHRFGFLRFRPYYMPMPSQTVPTGRIYSSIADMARWAGIHLGTVDVNEQFTRVVQRSRVNHHALEGTFANARDPLGEALIYYSAGWNIYADGSIGHGGSTATDFANVRMFPEHNIAVVVLFNSLPLPMHMGQWIPIVFEAVYNENFASATIDIINPIVDIVFIVLAIAGILFIGLFVRLAVKVSKQLRNGEKIKSKLRIRWLIGLFLTIIGLFGFHVLAPMAFGGSFSTFLMLFPLSTPLAIIAVWIMAVYSLFSLWAKIFVSPR